MRKILLIIAAAAMMLPLPVGARTVTGKDLVRMGEFKITAYCPCDECSEGYGRLTSTGKYARSGHTIAVDPDVIGYGSRVLIGDSIYVAEDCGGIVKGDHIDIFVDTHEEVEEFEVKYKNVWVVRGDIEQ